MEDKENIHLGEKDPKLRLYIVGESPNFCHVQVLIQCRSDELHPKSAHFFIKLAQENKDATPVQTGQKQTINQKRTVNWLTGILLFCN